MAKHTPCPWNADDANGEAPFGIFDADGNAIAYLSEASSRGTGLPYRQEGRERITDYDAHRANAFVLAAAADLFEAARLQEIAELAHLTCAECDGEEIPELCATCFPLYDDARVKRRAALSKAEPTA